jgi:hypothetical protein
LWDNLSAEETMLFSVVGENGAPIVNLPGWLCLQLAGICLVLYVLWKSKSEAAESIRSVLLPVAFGQLVVLLLTVAFQLSESPILIRLDNSLDIFYARYHTWFEFRFAIFAGIVIVLVILNFVFRRARLVTRFLKLEKGLGFTSVVLATFASFTFAAQYSYSLGPDRDAKVMPRSKSPEEIVEMKQLNRAADAILEQAFSSMPPEKLRQYASLLQRVDQTAHWTRHKEILRSALEPAFSGDIPPPDPSESETSTKPPEETSEGTPASEAWLGLYKIMYKGFSTVLPLSESIVGEFARTSVDGFSEQLSERGYRSSVGKQFDALVEKVESWPAPRVETELADHPIAPDRGDLLNEIRRSPRGNMTVDKIDWSRVPERRESPLTKIIEDRIRDRSEPIRPEKR